MQRSKSILRAVFIRMLAYAALCLIAVGSLVDFGSVAAHHPSAAVTLPGGEETPGPGWPRLGGPGYDAHADDTVLADAWPAAGPPVLWVREIGAGFSGFVAQGRRAYTQVQGMTDQKVLALDADSGAVIWEHSYGWPYQAGGMYPGPRSTPTLANGRIYFAAPNGLVGCLGCGDGHAIWSVNVLQKFAGQGATFGFACSPVVEEGKVILAVGGPSASVVALDADTGATRWTAGNAPASYSSPLPITFHGRRQIAVFLKNTLAGFDVQTGRLLWEQAYDRGFDEHAAALIYREPYLRATQAYRAGSDLYELQAGPAAQTDDGVPACHIKKIRHDTQMSNDVASGILVDGYVYGFDLRDMQASGGRPSHGTFRCMEFTTGVVRWSSEAIGQAGIVAADGKLLMLNDRGQVLLVRVNSGRCEELARADVFPGETCWTAPSLEHGRLYLRSPTRAACLFVGRPERMTSRQRALAEPLAAIPKSRPRDLHWLIGAEREGPFEMPDAPELMRWYLFSLGALALAGLFAGIVHGILRIAAGRWMPLPAMVVLYLGFLLFGIIATPLANHYGSQFVFTWPLALLAAHQIALAMVTWSKHPPHSARREWSAFAGAAFLIFACVIYFKLTRQLSLIPGWYFLLMLPAAWPLAVPAARRLCRRSTLAENLVWMTAVFSLYFWAAGGVMLWRTATH